MNLYVAAPLFSEADRVFNLTVARALEAEGHHVYLPQRNTPAAEGAERTTAIFHASLAALTTADAVVAICDGPQVDDGTAWEIGYAYGRNLPIYGLRTDTRIVQQPDERINLMILGSLNDLSSTIERVLHTRLRALWRRLRAAGRLIQPPGHDRV
jgi:nucleoside 2-deoxyribosyltransferase